jgi:transposase
LRIHSRLPLRALNGLNGCPHNLDAREFANDTAICGLQHADVGGTTSGNVSQTCRFFGVSRALFYIWKERYEKHGVAGLRDLPRRPHNIRFRIPPEIVSLILRIREERRYGAVRVSLYLQRHYHADVSPATILKIFHRHRVGPVSLKKYRPGPKPPDAPLQVPGRSVQLDVKLVPGVGRTRRKDGTGIQQYVGDDPDEPSSSASGRI